MAQRLPDCQYIASDSAYSYSSPFPHCASAKRFDFNFLWDYTTSIYDSCTNDSRLYTPAKGILASRGNISLTQQACLGAAGWDWKRHPRADIWTRLTTWKFPLLQLAFLFPRPPLSFATEFFVVVHLLGDPVDTIANLLNKASVCQFWAGYWQKAGFRANDDESVDWRALTLITDAYTEWQKDVEAAYVFREALSLNTTIFINVEAFSIAFSALYFWIIRTVIFGSIIGVSQTENAIPRILNRFQNDLNHSQELKNKIPLPNIHPEDDEHPESHEKMKKRRARRRFYGGIYSWIPSNHKSQKKSDSHRNQWFLHCKQMEHLHDPANTQFAEEELRTLNAAAALGARSESFHMAVAHMTGVAMATARLSISPPVLPAALGARSKSLHMAIALIAVIAGAAVGFSISSLVPPGGFNCQHIGELAIVVAWLASAYLDTQLNKVFLIGGDTLTVSKWRVERKTLLFWTTFTKDLAFTLATLMGVVLTQWGVMNRCACYTNWGRKGLALPQMPDVDKILYERINLHYWLIAALGLAFQLLVVLGCVWWRCPLAFRVYIQRDDAQSNWPQWLRVMFNKIRRFFDFKRKRTATSSVELAEGQDESDVTVVSAEVFRERPPNQRAQHSREPLLPQKADSP